MKVDPRHLSQLSTIVESGSFQLAADQLGLTQPALSRNMRLLEERVGMTLFQRDGRRSVPNALGLRLARSGLSIRIAQEQAAVAADQFSRGVVGELCIGAPPIVAGRFLTGSIVDFMNDNPSCSIELRTGLVHELRTMLTRMQIDMVLGPESLADNNSDLVFEHLIDDRVGILCRAGHPLTKKHTVAPEDLESQMWVAHSKASLLRQQTEAAMVASGVHAIQIGLETDSIRTVLEVVARTELITTMPRASTGPYLGEQLVFLNFDHPQFERPLGVIKRKDTVASDIEERFLGLLIERV